MLRRRLHTKLSLPLFSLLVSPLLIFGYCALSATAHATPAITARDIASMSFEQLQDLRVQTATRFLEDPLRVPASTSLITEKDWRERGARRTHDALRSLPGIYVSDSLLGSPIMNFRGFAGISTFKGYALQLDGVPLNMYTLQSPSLMFPEIPLGNLEQIEVIRSPGSALYGTDAFFGTAALRSWSPDEDMTEISAAGGVFNYHSESIRTSQSIGEDWRVTLIASYQNLSDRHQDFQYTGTTTGDLISEKVDNSYYSGGYTGKVAYQDLEFIYHYLEHVGRDVPGQPEVATLGISNGATSRISSAGQIYLLNYNPELTDNLVLDASGYYTSGSSDGMISAGPGSTPMSRPPSLEHHSDLRTGVDITLKKPFRSDRYQALIGYAFDRMDNRDPSTDPDRLMPATGAGINRNVNSVYGQIEIEPLGDLLRLTLGGRHDHYSDFGDETSPRAAMVVPTSKSSAFKLMYGHAFRAPGMIEQIGQPGILQGGGSMLQPEELETYEAAWRYKTDTFSFGATGFYTELTDGIQIVPNPAGPDAVRWANISEAQSLGGELELEYCQHGFTVEANYSFARAQQREPMSDGEQYRAFPKHMLNLSTRLAATDDISVSLHNSAYFSFQSSEPLTAVSYSNNSQPLPAYWRTDLHLTYRLEDNSRNAELFLHIEDIFDRQDTVSAPTGLERGVIGSGIAAFAGIRLKLQ